MLVFIYSNFTRIMNSKYEYTTSTSARFFSPGEKVGRFSTIPYPRTRTVYRSGPDMHERTTCSHPACAGEQRTQALENVPGLQAFFACLKQAKLGIVSLDCGVLLSGCVADCRTAGGCSAVMCPAWLPPTVTVKAAAPSKVKLGKQAGGQTEQPDDGAAGDGTPIRDESETEKSSNTIEGDHVADKNPRSLPQRPRSALFGGLRPEGRLKQRAMELLKEQHSIRREMEDFVERVPLNLFHLESWNLPESRYRTSYPKGTALRTSPHVFAGTSQRGSLP